MQDREWSTLRWNPDLDVDLFHACCIKHAFPTHMHDYYVICLIEKGLQSFSHRGAKYMTPAGGLVMLNPGDDHTGEPADGAGFEYRAIYPTAAHMREALFALTGRHHDDPHFPRVRVDDPALAACVRSLHAALFRDPTPLEAEALYIHALTAILARTAAGDSQSAPIGREREAVRKARQYILSCWSQKITLSKLSEHVGLSRYHFLRVFCRETGMPPHCYQDSIRMGHAKRLLRQGLPPQDVALATGFSDQSHFANRFKRLVGVTPGFYARQHLL